MTPQTSQLWGGLSTKTNIANTHSVSLFSLSLLDDSLHFGACFPLGLLVPSRAVFLEQRKMSESEFCLDCLPPEQDSTSMIELIDLTIEEGHDRLNTPEVVDLTSSQSDMIPASLDSNHYDLWNGSGDFPNLLQANQEEEWNWGSDPDALIIEDLKSTLNCTQEKLNSLEEKLDEYTRMVVDIVKQNPTSNHRKMEPAIVQFCLKFSGYYSEDRWDDLLADIRPLFATQQSNND